MRILHIDTERGWRGGERQALWLARELRRRGHVSIVAARPGEPLAPARERARDSRSSPVRRRSRPIRARRCGCGA